MKKRFIACAGAAALVVAAVVPLGSAFGVISNSKQCIQTQKAAHFAFVFQFPNEPSQAANARFMQFDTPFQTLNCD